MLEKKNLDTCIFLKVDNVNNLKYFFIAFVSYVHRLISSIRQIITIDCTFLKGKLKKKLCSLRQHLMITINFIMLYIISVTV